MSLRPAVALSIAALGCAAPDPGPPPLPLAVEFAGCAAVTRGPVCVPAPDRPVVLWVSAPPGATLEVAPGAPPSESVADGARFRVAVPDGTAAVTVRATAGAARGEWRLPLATTTPHAEVAAARALRAGGKAAEAAERLAAALPALPLPARAEALGLLGRLEHGRGRPEAAYAHLREAIRAGVEAGHVSQPADDAFALAYFLVHDARRLDEARAALDEVEPLVAAYPEGASRLPYYRAVVSQEAWDLRAALAQADEAEARATRLDVRRIRDFARQTRAGVFRQLGRHTEAVAVLESLRADAPAAPPCDRAQLLNNLGWAYTLAGGGDPIPLLEAAVALYGGECGRPADEANARVSLATAQLRAGRPAAARAQIEAVRASPRLDAFVAPWLEDLEGELALAEGHPEAAIERFGRRLADPATPPELVWRAHVGLGRAHRARGSLAEAAAVLGRAEALVEALLLRAPLAEGRGAAVSELEAGTRLYLDALLALDRPAEALAVARRASARLLRHAQRIDRMRALPEGDRRRWERAIGEYRRRRAALEQAATEDWQHPAPVAARRRAERAADEATLRRALDEALSTLPREPADAALSVPAPGELLLAYAALPEGWVGFAADERGVVARRLPAVDPRAPADTLLAPFATQIARAARLRVLAPAALRDVDFHALPWGDGPLLARLPVAYGADLPPLTAGAPHGPALVVADPQDNLPGARAEAEAVAQALRARAHGVVVLAGAAASGEAVRAHAARAAVLHFAGHAVFAGREGWDSALPLADGARLGLGDILALPAVPPRVVLAGCETARTDGGGRGEGIGLAHAFLSAGAREVLAAPRPVPDALAARLAGALHARADADLATALRAVQLELRAAGEPEWAVFRVLVR